VFILILLFIVLPIAELYVIIQVGDAIGLWPTLALLLLDGFLGAYLARTQGRVAWRRLNEAIGAGRVPAKEAYDGAAIVTGGALLLSPGFITDIFGFLLLIPPTRAMLRRLLLAVARRVGPTRSVFFLYDRRPGAGRSRAEGEGQGGTRGTPPPGPAAGAGNGASRPYDFDGSAREIPEDAPELNPGTDA
jgi:UPF0716 protein FxsA